MDNPVVKSFIILVMCVALVISGASMFGFKESADDGATQRVEDAVRRAVMTYYAIEGHFPPSLHYLAENYALILNEDRYFYFYEVFGSNLMPHIQVVPIMDIIN